MVGRRLKIDDAEIGTQIQMSGWQMTKIIWSVMNRDGVSVRCDTVLPAAHTGISVFVSHALTNLTIEFLKF